MPEDLDQVTTGTEIRTDRRRAGRAGALPAPAVLARSCHGAYRYARPRARRARRTASGSSPYQTIENTAEQAAVEVRADPHEVGAGNLDGDSVANIRDRRRRSISTGFNTNCHRDHSGPGSWRRRRSNCFGRRPKTPTPAENLVRVDIVLPRHDRYRRARRKRRCHDLALQRLRPPSVGSPPAICVHDYVCGHIHIPRCLRSARRFPRTRRADKAVLGGGVPCSRRVRRYVTAARASRLRRKSARLKPIDVVMAAALALALRR